MLRTLLFGTCLLGSAAAIAEDPALVEGLAKGASKAIYLTEDCGHPIDKEKFKQMAKLKAFTEGFGPIRGIDWETVKPVAMEKLQQMRSEYPDGAYCKQLLNEVDDVLPMIEKR